MTAAEVYELTTQGGTSDFAQVIRLCEDLGPYCLIGGLAVNCYVEPVYTIDADLVIVSSALTELADRLAGDGFTVRTQPHYLNADAAESQLRIQFTTDPRFQAFCERTKDHDVLDIPTRVAALADVVQGKCWAYSDPQRRLTKRKKDELDLLRLGEAYPEIRSMLPPELQRMLAES